jgi:integrase
MHDHHGKRRLPVSNRGRRVPNLYRRPKRPGDTRYGETFEVIFRDEFGRQRQKTLKARTLQRAIEEAEEYRTLLRRGEVLPPSLISVDEVVEEYFAVLTGLVKTGERAASTVSLYRQRYQTHVKPLLGSRRIQDMRAEHVAAIYDRQRGKNLAPWTISGTHTLISGLFRFALARGYLAANPLARLDRMERPRQQSRREARRLSDEEIRLLCENATAGYRPVVTTLAWTGLRVSEALGLRWQDINFEAREIRVEHQLAPNGSLKPPKTKAGSRSIPLLPVLERELRAHRKAQLSRGLAGAEQLVFTTATGQPLDRHNVRNRGIVPAARKAGLEREGEATVTTHDLRRTFISHLIIRLQLDPVRVAKIAGHSNVSETLNTYADEFDKAMFRDDLLQRIEKVGFGAVSEGC